MHHVDEGFQEMNGGDADQRGRQFDCAWIDMRKPFLPVEVRLQIQRGDNGGVATDHDHGEQMCHHGHLD